MSLIRFQRRLGQFLSASPGALSSLGPNVCWRVRTWYVVLATHRAPYICGAAVSCHYAGRQAKRRREFLGEAFWPSWDCSLPSWTPRRCKYFLGIHVVHPRPQRRKTVPGPRWNTYVPLLACAFDLCGCAEPPWCGCCRFLLFPCLQTCMLQLRMSVFLAGGELKNWSDKLGIPVLSDTRSCQQSP